MMCSQEPICKSFNFCHGKVCEINKVDILESNDTEPDLNCFYVGMRAETMPQCMEDDEVKNITDDTYPGLCQINQKRTDSSEWGE